MMRSNPYPSHLPSPETDSFEQAFSANSIEAYLAGQWANEPWGVVLAGWPSLGGGYWVGTGPLAQVAWLDGNGHWWVNGARDHTLNTSRPLVPQLDHWIQQQALVWQPISVEGSTQLPALPNGGWILYSAYEAFEHLEPALKGHAKSDPEGWPVFMLVAFTTYHWFDPVTGQAATWHYGDSAPTHWQSPEPTLNALPLTPAATLSMTPSLDCPSFERAVSHLLEAIGQGELYQANLSLRFEAEVSLEPLDLLAHLMAVNPSPFSGALKTPWGWLVSNSPERLVAVDKTDQVSARPIAGTRPKGTTAQANDALMQDLQVHPKDRAEHLMLVDLARNDLGQVCRPGSVEVDELLSLEQYSHVTHLVSNVVGLRQPGTSALAIWAATFPGGTITGCPKIRCITSLNHLEPVARTFYTGALGWLDASNQTLDTNILIRSVRLLPTGQSSPCGSPVWRAQFHAGAGVVADSQPAAEYDESLRKAAVMAQTLAQLTQRFTPIDACLMPVV